jgi:ASC-1-like (ASCH) protein
MSTHKLRIEPVFFEAVQSGRKTFEIRDDDRGFHVGDTVMLCEFNGQYTGRRLSAAIGYVTNFEQKPGYVVFSLLNPKIEPEIT